MRSFKNSVSVTIRTVVGSTGLRSQMQTHMQADTVIKKTMQLKTTKTYRMSDRNRAAVTGRLTQVHRRHEDFDSLSGSRWSRQVFLL